jgi:hypothetical protein
MKGIRAKTLSAHVLLMLAIGVDSFRRQQSGGNEYLFYLLGAPLFVIPFLFFARQPAAFFFKEPHLGADRAKLGILSRTLAWIFVIIFPVAWIILVSEFRGLLDSHFGVRLIGAYAFFFWCAATAILVPLILRNRHEN